MILCFDGGGSSSRMLLADEDFNLIGNARGLGVNAFHTPLEEVRENLRLCVRQTLDGQSLHKSDVAVITMTGSSEELEALLLPYGCAIYRMSEPQTALWAGAMRKSGFVALSGTGSDVFYIDSEGHIKDVIGGLGLLLGDQGSGAWIGQHALRAAAHELDGTGAPTTLTGRARECLGIRTAFDIVKQLYAAPSYVRYMADFVPEAAAAAREGDEIAISLFRQAGGHLSRQLLCLLDRVKAPGGDRFCVISGGAWKAHPAMFEQFREDIRAQAPDMTIKKPYFEPVMAGVVQRLAEREPTWPVEKRVVFLTERFPQYRIPDDHT